MDGWMWVVVEGYRGESALVHDSLKTPDLVCVMQEGFACGLGPIRGPLRVSQVVPTQHNERTSQSLTV